MMWADCIVLRLSTDGHSSHFHLSVRGRAALNILGRSPVLLGAPCHKKAVLMPAPGPSLAGIPLPGLPLHSQA